MSDPRSERWMRIALGYWDDPKIVRAGGAPAGEVHQRMIAWCKAHPKAAGVVPDGVALGKRATRAVLDALVREGLLHRVEGGHEVHDVEVWQDIDPGAGSVPAGSVTPSEADARRLAISEARRLAGRKGAAKTNGKRSANGDFADGKRSANGSANGEGLPGFAAANGSAIAEPRASDLEIRKQEKEGEVDARGAANGSAKVGKRSAKWGDLPTLVTPGSPEQPWCFVEAAYRRAFARHTGKTAGRNIRWRADFETIADVLLEHCARAGEEEHVVLARVLDAHFETADDFTKKRGYPPATIGERFGVLEAHGAPDENPGAMAAWAREAAETRKAVEHLQ